MLHYFILFLHSRMSAIIIIFILFSLNPPRSSRLPLPHSVSSLEQERIEDEGVTSKNTLKGDSTVIQIIIQK